MKCVFHEWKYSIDGMSLRTGTEQYSNARRYCWRCKQRESFDIWSDYRWPVLEGITRFMGLKPPLQLASMVTKVGWRKL